MDPVPRPGPVTCVLLGAGGHASVLLDCLALSGAATVAGVLVPDQALWGTTLAGVSVLGGDDLMPDLLRRGVTHFVVGLGGAGNNRPRQRLFDLAARSGLVPLTVIHPSSIVSPRAAVGPGCQLLPGSIVNAGATLGANVIVNSGAIVEHDCAVSDHVHVATGARLAGSVTVGTGAHVGAGATVIQGRHVADWAVVGAGAVVAKDVESGVTVVGVPAAPLPGGRRPLLHAD
jgi:UDP-perosamine 4-acetyltransferase